MSRILDTITGNVKGLPGCMLSAMPKRSAPLATRRASLADVAESVKVSVSTVSKVANGSGDVAAETRERVSRALDQFGYVATQRRKNRQRITLMIRGMESPYPFEVLRGITDTARDLNVDICVEAHPAPQDGPTYVDRQVALGRSGAIAVMSALTEAQSQRFEDVGMPLVIVDPYLRAPSSAYLIGATQWQGAVDATEHLLGLGHHDFVLLAADTAAIAARARVSGFHAALSHADVRAGPDAVLVGEFSYESGLAQGLEVLSRRQRPTAIVASSDLQALGVIEAARLRDVRVPSDVSVVGFDNLILGRTSSPPLTTISQPLAEMGGLALRTLLASLSGETPSRSVELATNLVIRSSTAPPPAGPASQ